MNKLTQESSDFANINFVDFLIRELLPGFNQEEKTRVFPLNNLLSREDSNYLYDFASKIFSGNC